MKSSWGLLNLGQFRHRFKKGKNDFAQGQFRFVPVFR